MARITSVALELTVKEAKVLRDLLGKQCIKDYPDEISAELCAGIHDVLADSFSDE